MKLFKTNSSLLVILSLLGEIVTTEMDAFAQKR